ncbi:MAG: pilus assembly PilX N-terminal domain-containing protein, partial [Gemmatimonadetes bacterium]|nr:pilus assembly PilX N-terminal domain-containing protein [Gemmatimonadota bacterium]
MKRILRDERGMALAVAIFALVVVGALVAGAFFAGTQEQRVAENTKRVQQSFGIADAGLAEVVRTWNPVAINQRGTYPGDSIQVAQTRSPSGTGSYGGVVYKLNPNLYLLDVTGADSMSRANRIRGGGARQRLGMITRIRPLQININASLTTQGNVDLSGNAAVDGNDHLPPSWTDCDPLDTNRAGVRTTSTGTVTTSGNATVTGTPTVVNDPTLTSSAFTQYGDVDYNQLAARASITLSGGTYTTEPVITGGVCDKNRLTNWGDGINQ